MTLFEQPILVQLPGVVAGIDQVQTQPRRSYASALIGKSIKEEAVEATMPSLAVTASVDAESTCWSLIDQHGSNCGVTRSTTPATATTDEESSFIMMDDNQSEASSYSYCSTSPCASIDLTATNTEAEEDEKFDQEPHSQCIDAAAADDYLEEEEYEDEEDENCWYESKDGYETLDDDMEEMDSYDQYSHEFGLDRGVSSHISKSSSVHRLRRYPAGGTLLPVGRVAVTSQRSVSSNIKVLSQACKNGVSMKRAIRPRKSHIRSPYEREERHDYMNALNQQQLRATSSQWKNVTSAETVDPKPVKQNKCTKPIPPFHMHQQCLRKLHSYLTKLPICVRRETRNSWQHVLQVRLIKKHAIAERNSLKPGRLGCNTTKFNHARLQHSTRPKNVVATQHPDHRTFLQAHKARVQTTRQQLKLSQRLPRSKLTLPADPHGLLSLTNRATQGSTKLVAGRRWLTKLRLLKSEDSDSDSNTTSALPVTTLAPQRRSAPRLESRFDAFRRRWFYDHRDEIETSLDPARGTQVTAVSRTNMDKAIIRQFMQKKLALGDRNPTLTFHGTNPAHHETIQRYGLLVPGKRHWHGFDIKVLNGQSLGRGVYSNRTAGYSLGYSCSSDKMFICAVLMKNPNEPADGGVPHRRNRSVVQSGNMIVAFQEERIIPLFFLHFAPSQPGSAHHSSHVESIPLTRREARQQKKLQQPSKVIPKQLLRVMLRKAYSIMINNSKQLKADLTC